jgi:2,3-bisphosphoglycerate-independent phosphoglycerate mutase
MNEQLRQPAVMLILDGFGVAPPSRGNAIALAKTPVIDGLMEKYPTMTLQASGESVGLPWGDMGNSEVGHISLGSGRILFQELPRITRSIVDGSFFTNPVFHQATERAFRGGKLHIVGMFSSAGVHSFDEHAFALLELCQRQKVSEVYIHVILDGRDSPYNSGREFVEKLQKKMASIGLGKIATISGRWYAMDRDNRWERIAATYQAMVDGAGPTSEDPIAAIDASYQAGVYDEQFVPTVITHEGKPVAQVGENDAVIFFNYRSDRARELTKAFVLPGLDKFPRTTYLKDVLFVTMTEYEANLPVSVAYMPEEVTEPLARVYSDAGLAQLHAAETEKYAHVTFFFNGGREAPFSGEDRILVPSPSVASYDQKPAMSAREITERVVKALTTKPYALVVVNFANPDMIGHTGNIPATIEGIEVVDECVGQIVETVKQMGGFVMITADHGNAEQKIDGQTSEVSKEHSANPVPLIIVGDTLPPGLERYHAPMRDLSALTPVGVLADVAPTLLALAGLPIPASMTGHNLLRRL